MLSLCPKNSRARQPRPPRPPTFQSLNAALAHPLRTKALRTVRTYLLTRDLRPALETPSPGNARAWRSTCPSPATGPAVAVVTTPVSPPPSPQFQAPPSRIQCLSLHTLVTSALHPVTPSPLGLDLIRRRHLPSGSARAAWVHQRAVPRRDGVNKHAAGSCTSVYVCRRDGHIRAPIVL